MQTKMHQRWYVTEKYSLQFIEIPVWKNPSLSFWMLPLSFVAEYFVQNPVFYDAIDARKHWRYKEETNEEVSCLMFLLLEQTNLERKNVFK